MAHGQTRRGRYSRRDHDAKSTPRHELFTSGEVMMSVHFDEAPSPEARALFQEIADKIASGEITMPDFPQPGGRILNVRKGDD
jgi:hypothetical protein